MRRFLIAFTITLSSLAAPASAESFLEFWAKETSQIELKSQKPTRALAFCLAVQYEELTGLRPSILEGEDPTVEFVSANSGGGMSLIIYTISTKIQDNGNERILTVKARKAWDGRAKQVTEKCL